MEFARQYIDLFADLFRGNPNSHGIHIPEKKKKKKGEKLEGESFTRKTKLTHKHYLKHLHGEEAIGIVPLDAQGNIRFAVIDVDVYPLNPIKYLRILKKADLPFVGFRSKSGGLHLYLFLLQDTAAAKIIPVMREILQLLGLKPDTEIFPKQSRLVGEQKGSWINLPYFKYKETVRYAYDEKGKGLDLKKALALADESRVNLKTLLKTLEQAPLSAAPPCLQTLYMAGGADEGHRNVFLFNCATYLKARFGKDFSEHLHTLNSKCLNPIEYEELDRTVISSHNKGDYSYQCSDPVLSLYCNKELCKSREYGKGTGAVSDLSFEQLIQVHAASPYYRWWVNGAEMIFYSESELMNQNKFRELCLRLLHKVPNRLKDNAWNNVLNRALSNLKVEAVEQDDDLSEDSLWLSKVVEFFERRPAMRPSQVEDGLVWQADNGELHFKGAKLLEHLEKTNLFRTFKKAQHRNLLNTLGAIKSKLRYTDLDKSGRTWSLNLNAMHEKGLFLNINSNGLIEDEEEKKPMEPLDFVGEEKY